MGKEELYIPVVGGSYVYFAKTNFKEEAELRVKKYNTERDTIPYDQVNYRARWLGDFCKDRGIYDYARAMAVLEIAREGRMASRLWGLSADIALVNGDREFAREFAIHDARDGYSEKRFAEVKRESADDNVADIMGMITDELGESGELSEDDYNELLENFAPLLVRWRELRVPKYKDGDAYEIMYGILEQCYEHKAYRTALRMLGLLYVVEKKNMPNLINTNILSGKIMYELGYKEVAKRCFLFAARDYSKKRRPPFPEEYREFLEQETDLEITDEIIERQKFIEEGIASGKIKAYTKEEVDKYHDGKLKIDVPDSEKQEKERKKIAEKALDTYEEYEDGSAKKRLKGIDEAFKVLTEEPEVYEEAAYLYFLKANIYLEADDLKKAYDCIKKAYKCKNGNRNGMVLLCTANILSRMERHSEATVYVFRSYILFGEEFVTEKLGDGAMEALEDYLDE